MFLDQDKTEFSDHRCFYEVKDLFYMTFSSFVFCFQSKIGMCWPIRRHECVKQAYGRSLLHVSEQ